MWGVIGAIVLGPMGCSTVPHTRDETETAPGFAFSAGRATQSYRAPLSIVMAAITEAAGDLNLTSIRTARDGAVSRLEGETGDQRRVAAMIRTKQGITQVSVRVGWFGDEPLSRALLERVGVRLGSRDPEAIPASPPSSPAGNPFFARDAVPDSVMLRDFAEAPYRDRVVP
jgi:hypothetical protein